MQHSLQGFFFRKSFLGENPWVEITFEFISYGIEYRGISHGTFGCLPFTKSFWEIWLETKWKLKRLFGSFQQKISRSKGTSEKVVVALGRNYICKIASLIPVLGLRGCFSVKGTDLYKWQTRFLSKFTGPEFGYQLPKQQSDRFAHVNA